MTCAISWPRAENWYSTFFSGTSRVSSNSSIARLVSTSRATSAQSTPGSGLKSDSGSAAIASAIHRLDDGGDKAIDGMVGHPDDIKPAAVGHVDRMVLAQLHDLRAADRQHREHSVL